MIDSTELLKQMNTDLGEIIEDVVQTAVAIEEWFDGKPVIIRWEDLWRVTDDHDVGIASLKLIRAVPLGRGLYLLNGGDRSQARRRKVPLDLMVRYHEGRLAEARRIVARHNSVA